MKLESHKEKLGKSGKLALISIKEQMVSSEYPEESKSQDECAESKKHLATKARQDYLEVIFQAFGLFVLTKENRRMNTR